MIWNSTGHKGIRFRKHKTRKHGIKFDRYYSIRLQRDGQRIEEGLGWESEGWTLDKAISTLAKLKEAHKIGSGPTRLKEHRAIAKKKKADSAKEKMTFEQIYSKEYLPHAKANKKPETIWTEHSMFKLWISPIIGKLPLKEIAPFHLEKIKHNMKKAGRSSRRISYCLAVVRQVFNFAFRNDLFLGVNPVRKIKLPHSDNKRRRFLSVDEAETLLAALKKESMEVYEQSLISLHTGLRASEIFKLRWVDIDLENGLINCKDTKSKKPKTAYMTDDIKNILSQKTEGLPDDLIYPGPDGMVRMQISRAFQRVVKELGFNDGVVDRRDRVVFHTLRHSFASWLAQGGVDLFVIMDRLGHSSLSMTQRYSHLAPENSKRTVSVIEDFMKKGKGAEVIDISSS